MKRVLNSFLFVLLSLGVLELASRMFLFPQYTAMLPDMYEEHPVLGHYTKPNLSVRRYNPLNYDVVNRTNSMGMRGSEENLKRELDGVWFAGGSNTFGGYVEDDEVFVSRLRQQGIWAANLASEGHSLPSQVATIKLVARRGHKPKAVVVVLSMYFGIADYSAFQKDLNTELASSIDNPKPTHTARDNLQAAIANLKNTLPLSYQEVRAGLLRSSALYGWFKVGILGIPPLREWTKQKGLRADLDLVRNFNLNLLRPLTSNNPATGRIRSTADYVAGVSDLVRDRFNVPFGVVLLPSHHQLHPEGFDRFLAHHNLTGENLDTLRPMHALQTQLKRRNITVLDTYPVLRQSNLSRMTFPDDGHLNSAAHRVVSKAVADWLNRVVLVAG